MKKYFLVPSAYLDKSNYEDIYFLGDTFWKFIKNLLTFTHKDV